MAIISNVKVYDINESVKASKYPMAVNPEACSSEVTNMTRKLASAPSGSAHDCFLKGIVVNFDLTFTVKAWTEMERYHFADIVSSMSTMHRIARFDLDEQFESHVDQQIIERLKKLQEIYNNMPDDDPDKKEAYLILLYSCPVGLKLTARVTTNFLQLKTIYAQRKNHRLPEWREMCKWIQSLPYFVELVLN